MMEALANMLMFTGLSIVGCGLVILLVVVFFAIHDFFWGTEDEI